MLNIYIVRHGETLDNLHEVFGGRRDEPLTELGESQALETAKHITSLSITFDAVFTSPLIRTRKTAEIISNALHTGTPEVLDDLIERDAGVMTGEPLSRIRELCGANIIETDTVTYFLSAKGAEAFPQMLTRSRRLLKRIAMRHPNGNVLFVSHGDIGKMLYAAYYHLDWKEVLTAFHFGNGDILLLSPEASPDEAHVFKQTAQSH